MHLKAVSAGFGICDKLKDVSHQYGKERDNLKLVTSGFGASSAWTRLADAMYMPRCTCKYAILDPVG